MKQRAKIKWDAELQQWQATYSDGFTEYSPDDLGAFIDGVTEWEADQVKAQQEVSG